MSPLVIDPYRFGGAPSYVASAQSTGTTPITIAVPTGTADGDLMLAFVVAGTAGATYSTPSGWTLVVEQHATSPSLYVFSRVASSEPASYNFTPSAGSGGGQIRTYRGASAVDASGVQNNASSTSVVAPSITTTVAKTRVVWFGRTNAVVTWTAPSGGWGNEAPGGSSATDAWDLAVAATGATGTQTATASSAAANSAALVAVKA